MLRERDVQLYLANRFCAGTAHTLLRTTIAWQVYEITGSPMQLGLLGLAQFVPTLFLSLVAGAAADSYDRRRIVMMSQAPAVIGAALLLWLSASGEITLAAIYPVVLVAACASSFEQPAGASILPELVPRHWFAHATAVQASVRNLAWVTGPGATGFLVVAFGAEGAYAVTAALLLLSIVLIRGVRSRSGDREAAGVTLVAIQQGVAFVRSRPAILGAMVLDMLAVIFGAAEALLPVFAKDILGVGPRGYGVLAASFPAGTWLMSLLLVVLPPLHRAGRALLLAVAGYALFTIGFGLSSLFALSVLAFAGAGAADQVSMVARSVLIQLSTPDSLRGRVNSVNFVFIGASNHLGAAEAGFVAALTSATFAVVSGGLAALAVTAWIAWKIPPLRHYDARHPTR